MIFITLSLESIKKISFYESSIASTYIETKNALKTMKKVLVISTILEVISILLYGYVIMMLVHEKKYYY